MKDIVWCDILSVEVDEIDEDHRKLLNIYNILNHSGDIISLFNPNNELVDQFIYSKCSTGVPLSTNTPVKNEGEMLNEVEDSDQSEEKILGESSDQKTNPANKGVSNLQKINSFLKISNIDEESPIKDNNFVSKRVSIQHKSLPKYTIISVIIGGAILSSSGLFFIKIPNEKN